MFLFQFVFTSIRKTILSILNLISVGIILFFIFYCYQHQIIPKDSSTLDTLKEYIDYDSIFEILRNKIKV